jgi:hypothetical protein
MHMKLSFSGTAEHLKLVPGLCENTQHRLSTRIIYSPGYAISQTEPFFPAVTLHCITCIPFEAHSNVSQKLFFAQWECSSNRHGIARTLRYALLF